MQSFSGNYYDLDISRDGKLIVCIIFEQGSVAYRYNDATDKYDYFQEIVVSNQVYGIELIDNDHKAVIGDLIYRITDNSFELDQDLQIENHVFSVVISEDYQLLILGTEFHLKLFRYNGNSYEPDYDIAMTGWKKLFLSDDSKYLILGIWSPGSVVILKFNEGTQ